MATNKKKELVLITYEMLQRMSPKDIRIREIAAQANCTSTAIYKHFSDLDELILTACVKSLESYIIAVQEITKSNASGIEMLNKMWDAFSKIAFQNAEVFDLLFWGKYKDGLGDSIYEFYQLFPTEFIELDGFFSVLFFNNDLFERNRMIVHRAALDGYFDVRDENMIVEMQCNMFHGTLLRYMDTYRDPDVADKAHIHFMDMLEDFNEHYKKKSNSKM